jgi:hypothetical protein
MGLIDIKINHLAKALGVGINCCPPAKAGGNSTGGNSILSIGMRL